MNSVEEPKRTRHSPITKALVMLPMLVLALILVTTKANAAAPTLEKADKVTPSGANAAISGNVVITFSGSMDTGTAGTVQLNLLALTGGTWSNSDTYTIPYSGLSYSTRYVVNISGFVDGTFNTLPLDTNHFFITVAAPSVTVGSGDRSDEVVKTNERARVGHCKEWVNVRSGPGTDYDVIGRAYLDEIIELLEWNKGETWCKVLYNNGNALGWIHGRFIIPLK